MRLRPHVLLALLRKDVLRLLRNGPALMLLGFFALVAFLCASTGLVEPDSEPQQAAAAASPHGGSAWIVYVEETDWVRFLKARDPSELDLSFVRVAEIGELAYPSDTCVIELRPDVFDRNREQRRRSVRYYHPGSEPQVLWPVGRWFLSASLEYFGRMPALWETIQPLAPPTGAARGRAALENVSVADVLSLDLIGTALLSAAQFFAACGLLVSLCAQERERGSLRALLLTPATFIEFVLAKAVIHLGLALGTCALVVAALEPAALTSLLFWATMFALSLGYFAVGLLLAAFARTQTAPNLLSFAYLLLVGTFNLLAYRVEAFRPLSGLTFERYGLLFTVGSLQRPDLNVAESLTVIRTTEFQTFLLLVTGLVLLATLVGARRLSPSGSA